MSENSIVDTVKRWISVENDMKMLMKQVRDLREEKKTLTDALVKSMQKDDIDCFDTSSGKIVHATRKTKAPLSKKHLLTTLQEYFKGDATLAAQLSEHIMGTRDVKVVETIQRKSK